MIPRLYKTESNLLKAFATFAVLLLMSCQGNAQTGDDIKSMGRLMGVPHYPARHSSQNKEKNMVKAAVGALFVFYRNYISSQDGSHCSFYPSCSSYALQSIKKKGLIVGLLNTFDRLSRCNGLSEENYPLKKGTNLLYDPVD
jgi:putative membrane protein insertion efficiency factor